MIVHNVKTRAVQVFLWTLNVVNGSHVVLG